MLLKQECRLGNCTLVSRLELPLCVEALNARPIDLARVAEVTDILFASDELVLVGAKCSADLSRESGLDVSVGQSMGSAGAASSAPNLAGGVSGR